MLKFHGCKAKLRGLAVALAAASAALSVGGAEESVDRREQRRTPVVRVFEKAKPSVVNISATHILQTRDPFDAFDRFFTDAFDFPAPAPRRREIKSTSVGSGFVIHESGYVVTNAHVVVRTAERKVLFDDKRQFDAEIVALDTDHDLAVLKIEADRALSPLSFGRSDDLMIGETAVAIGNPMGLRHTLTVGVVSALDRELEIQQRVVYRGLIQTDASINPGNSGGPLLNILGELIGVNTAVRGDAQNIGFAIPVDQLSVTLPEMLDVERRYRIETGLTLSATLPPRVAAVEKGSPAERAKIRTGDVVAGVADAAVEKAVDFSIGLIGRRAGEKVPIRLERGGRSWTAEVILAEKPKPDGKLLAQKRMGLDLTPMTRALATKLRIPEVKGLVISRVLPDGPAAEIGVEPGDVLIEIGRHSLGSLDDLGLILEALKAGEPVHIGLLRITAQGIFRLRAGIELSE